MNLLATNIKKSFKNGSRSLDVLNGCNLTVNSGEIITIMGESGSGKSTLLNILGTLDTPNKGKIVIQGRDVSHLNEEDLAVIRNKYIGFVFQFHHLLPEFTALENVLLPSLIYDSSNDKSSRANSLLEFVGLIDRKDHLPSQLSGGERLRIAVLRALINSPKIVFADEPTGNLDEKNARKMVDLFHKINRDFNQSMVITTHSHDVASIGHRQLVLRNGILEEK